MSKTEIKSFYQGGIQYVPARESERNRNRVHIWPGETSLTIERLTTLLDGIIMRNPNPKRIFLFNNGYVDPIDPMNPEETNYTPEICAKGIWHSQEAVIEDVFPSDIQVPNQSGVTS